jgi:hypothetical protein
MSGRSWFTRMMAFSVDRSVLGGDPTVGFLRKKSYGHCYPRAKQACVLQLKLVSVQHAMSSNMLDSTVRLHRYSYRTHELWVHERFADSTWEWKR